MNTAPKRFTHLPVGGGTRLAIASPRCLRWQRGASRPRVSLIRVEESLFRSHRIKCQSSLGDRVRTTRGR